MSIITKLKNRVAQANTQPLPTVGPAMLNKISDQVTARFR